MWEMEGYMQNEREILFFVSKDNQNNQISVVKWTVTEQYEEKNGLKQLLDHIRMRISNTFSNTSAIDYLMQEMDYYDIKPGIIINYKAKIYQLTTFYIAPSTTILHTTLTNKATMLRY